MQEIFRYGSKGSKLGLLDVLKARANCEFMFSTSDGTKQQVKIVYDQRTKKYLYSVSSSKTTTACGTKGDLEVSLGRTLERLGFVGRDYKTSIGVLDSYGTSEKLDGNLFGDSGEQVDFDSLSSRKEDLEQSHLEKEKNKKESTTYTGKLSEEDQNLLNKKLNELKISIQVIEKTKLVYYNESISSYLVDNIINKQIDLLREIEHNVETEGVISNTQLELSDSLITESNKLMNLKLKERFDNVQLVLNSNFSLPNGKILNLNNLTRGDGLLQRDIFKKDIDGKQKHFLDSIEYVTKKILSRRYSRDTLLKTVEQIKSRKYEEQEREKKRLLEETEREKKEQEEKAAEVERLKNLPVYKKIVRESFNNFILEVKSLTEDTKLIEYIQQNDVSGLLDGKVISKSTVKSKLKDLVKPTLLEIQKNLLMFENELDQEKVNTIKELLGFQVNQIRTELEQIKL